MTAGFDAASDGMVTMMRDVAAGRTWPERFVGMRPEVRAGALNRGIARKVQRSPLPAAEGVEHGEYRVNRGHHVALTTPSELKPYR